MMGANWKRVLMVLIITLTETNFQRFTVRINCDEYGSDPVLNKLEKIPIMETKTDVIFRTDKNTGEIVAYFPYEIHTGFTASCYAHNGQHSACSHEYILQDTEPCENFEVLASELIQIGYDLNIIKRRNHSKFIQQVFK